MDELNKPLREINAQQEAIRISIQGFRREIEVSQRQLSSLQDAKTRRLGCLQRYFSPSFQAWEWLESNRSKFRQRVYGPLCLELHVADVQMADLIEGAIPRPVMTSTFYCYEEADYEILMSNLIDSLKLPVNISLMTVKNKDTFLANNNSITVRRFGFEGLAIEFVQADDFVLAALCEAAKLHLVPVSRKQLDYDKLCKTDSFTREFRKFIMAGSRFDIKANRYQPGDNAINSFKLPPAQYLGQNMDGSEELIANVRRLSGECNANEDKMKTLVHKEAALKEKVDALELRRNKIIEELDAEKRLLREFNERVKVINYRKDKLRQKQQAFAAYDEEPLKQQLRQLIIDRTEQLLKFHSVLLDLSAAITPQMIDLYEVSHLRRHLATLTTELEKRELQFQNAKAALQLAEQQLVEAKELAKRLLDTASKDPLDAATRDAFAQFPDNLHDLDQLITQEEAHLAFSAQAPDRRAIQDYESREEQIASLVDGLAKKRSHLASLHERITVIRDTWVPAVTAMTNRINARFGAFFAQMKCVGEVQLAPHPTDYDRWEMAIMVKFRDSEQLQRLSAFRQSGGEKSVSTILYLLSLQELSKSPFRVVDEINQGRGYSVLITLVSRNGCHQ